MRGLPRLLSAFERLDRKDRPLRQRLREASFEFLIAAVESESWPTSFRLEAERLRVHEHAVHVEDDGADGHSGSIAEWPRRPA